MLEVFRVVRATELDHHRLVTDTQKSAHGLDRVRHVVEDIQKEDYVERLVRCELLDPGLANLPAVAVQLGDPLRNRVRLRVRLEANRSCRAALDGLVWEDAVRGADVEDTPAVQVHREHLIRSLPAVRSGHAEAVRKRDLLVAAELRFREEGFDLLA
jgi:hypothetical protein